MKNAEMKVVRFSAEDVIATSGFCSTHNGYDHLYYDGSAVTEIKLWDKTTSSYKAGVVGEDYDTDDIVANEKTAHGAGWYYYSGNGYWCSGTHQ